uniref:7 transmembrane receptor (Rhodopsin family) A n=1 Tax=Philodina roseola TaxID=96448 RepID=B2L3H7_PHIRO|nr:7 transmembrane receptor (rhodopsin family) A [Philodina roseola]
MNSTTSNTTTSFTDALSYYIVCSISAGFGLIAIVLCLVIIILVKRTKPRLHTIRHLLVCNTCVASIFYCLMQSLNYAFLIFLPGETSDVGCRWRGYFAYMSISASIYSYLVQAVSRLFYSVSGTKHQKLITFKSHYIMISIHWLVVIILPLPSVITTDIYFRPGLLCWVPFKHTLHVLYTVCAYYLTSIICITIIYIYIYLRVKKARQHAVNMLHALHDKRDLEVLRNIVILLAIYISGGIPTIIFLVSSLETCYLLGIVTFTFTVVLEKIFTIILDRDLRITVRELIWHRNRVLPFAVIQPTIRYDLDRTRS